MPDEVVTAQESAEAPVLTPAQMCIRDRLYGVTVDDLLSEHDTKEQVQ